MSFLKTSEAAKEPKELWVEQGFGTSTMIAMPSPHRWAFAAFAVIFAISWWRPLWPVEQALHHSLTIIALVGLVWLQRRLRLPLSSFVLALGFLTLHTIAARWLYSYVPYQEWFPFLASNRNHFDRLVHFAWGLLLAPIIVQVLRDRGWRRGWALLITVQVVVATGALYEILEWGISFTLAPDAVEAYNGQQGDMFDPQRDQALALLGSLLGSTIAQLRPSGALA
jgi:putative membrane protein